MGQDGTLYIGGSFSGTANGDPVQYIAQYRNGIWQPLGSGTNGSVYALAISNTQYLGVGGSFQLAGDKHSTNIAVWKIPAETFLPLTMR
jgi:hypothetical protein